MLYIVAVLIIICFIVGYLLGGWPVVIGYSIGSALIILINIIGFKYL